MRKFYIVFLLIFCTFLLTRCGYLDNKPIEVLSTPHITTTHTFERVKSTESPGNKSYSLITKDNINQLAVINQISKDTITDISWSQEGNRLAVAGMDNGNYGVWMLDRKSLQEVWFRETGSTYGISLSPDGTAITLTTNNSGWPDESLDVENGMTIKKVKENQVCTGGFKTVWSSTGNEIISAYSVTDSSKYRIYTHLYSWNPKNGDCLGEVFKSEGWLSTLQMNPSGDMIGASLTGIKPDNTSNVILWDLPKKEIACKIAGSSVAFSPTKDFIAIENEHGEVEIWDPISCKKSNDLGTKGYSFAFSPDGRLLVVANGTNIEIWDFDKGTLITRFGSSLGGVGKIIFTPDGSFLSLLLNPVKSNDRNQVVILGIE